MNTRVFIEKLKILMYEFERENDTIIKDITFSNHFAGSYDLTKSPKLIDRSITITTGDND